MTLQRHARRRPTADLPEHHPQPRRRRLHALRRRGAGRRPGLPDLREYGGRVDVDTLLNPILGDSSTLSFFIRTTQIGAGSTWQAPGVTGGEQAGGTDDIFWGNLDTEGRARIQTGVSPISASTPVNDGQWYRVTQTRNATTGRARTYVNGVLVSEATTDPGVHGANFPAIGATTDLAGDRISVQGYNYLDGDLDQVEVFDRELTPGEIAQRVPAVHVDQPGLRQAAAPGPARTRTRPTPRSATTWRPRALGDATYGFRVDNLPADTTLPWINVNQVVLHYSAPLRRRACRRRDDRPGRPVVRLHRHGGGAARPADGRA